MGKRGDLIRQLAIITDLIDKMNLESITQELTFEISEEEFNRVLNYLRTEYDYKIVNDMFLDYSFTVVMDNVKVIFNKSSV